MTFHIITIFPSLFDSFMQESLIKKAQEKKRIAIVIHNLREYTANAHKTVDDKPYGGGAGMVMKIEPLVAALAEIRKKYVKTGSERIILLSPAGKQFTQRHAETYRKKYTHIIFICGRYEGVDARIKKYVDEELSLGPYVLNGGEVAAMAVVEAVSRLIPGVLGNKESLREESWNKGDALEYPQYTRPEKYHDQKVPRVLLSGDHAKIIEWRKKHTKKRKKCG
ncbi:tRNA (guanosine(37)-N1)-methyltransferase TrmD [Candidatus Uhrbacteria bacterium]|nr:tRNA (guanosine(37)-N1)-methyltransferase TrmD [Candidatus Uhrbacteria bacterium]